MQTNFMFHFTCSQNSVLAAQCAETGMVTLRSGNLTHENEKQ